MTQHAPKQTSLGEAVATHVRPGDMIHVIMGHSRWTALLREVTRQHWHRPAGFTLVMSSLSSLGAMLFRAGCLDKVITLYSGDSFPTYTPNPVFQRAYQTGEVEVEHWSFLSLTQRLTAAAEGLPAAVTGSLAGSSMAEQAAYSEVETPFGRTGLLAPLAPDVTLVHAAAADHAGNLAMAAPLLEGVAGAFASRRGVIATVDTIVDDLRPWAPAVRIPGHRVLAVVEAPFGAHPGGMHVGHPEHPQVPGEPYAEDIAFWIRARDATRTARLDDWIQEWCLDRNSHEAYLDRLGVARLDELRRQASPSSWKIRPDIGPVPTDDEASAAEVAGCIAVGVLADRVGAMGADAVLAGAGLANLVAWVSVARAREAGHDVSLAAELGLWGYQPTPGDPFIFNFQNFPSATALSDATTVLGTFVGGPGTRSIACVGAAQVDEHGALNSTLIPGGPFLVGSGGANDVVTRADETVVVTRMTRTRTVPRCGYVTSPGTRVSTVVTDKGVLVKGEHGRLVLGAVPDGEPSVRARVEAARDNCGWNLDVAQELVVLPPLVTRDLRALRSYDRERLFLSD